MKELHVYGNDYEKVIAESPDDAIRVWAESVGENVLDDTAEELGFEQYPDDALHTIWCNADGDPDEIEGKHCTKVTKTFGEWAKRGRGYLSTTEQ